MNKQISRIDRSEILFFDTESVRKSNELVPDTLEYNLYEYKTRDRDTDEVLPMEELQNHYKEKSGLKFPYVKVVAISVGYFNGDEFIIKELQGTEQEMLEEFYKLASHDRFSYLCGANILEWDIPLMRIRLSTYKPVVDIISDKFNDSGKKPWNLGALIDIFDLYKGTHRYNASLDELCMLYGVESPKDGGIKGAEVSEFYYDGKIEDIKKYCSRDVVSTAKVFSKMLGHNEVSNVINRSDEDTKLDEDVKTFLESLYQENELSEVEYKFHEATRGKKFSKKEKELLKEIILGVYVRCDFINKDQDNKKVIKIKEDEVNKLINNLE